MPKESRMEDLALLHGLSEGKTDTLSYIYRNCFSMIAKYVKQGGGNQEDAEDIFQEGLVVVYRQFKAGKLNLTCAFSTYLFAVCKRIWFKKKSRKKSVVDLKDINIEEAIVDVLIEKTERYALYKEKFKLLGKDCQKVLELFFRGERMEAIAQKMGYASENYAKKRKFNCKKKLIELIQQDDRFDELKEN